MGVIQDATGSTAVFGTSSFSFNLTGIGVGNASRESIPTSHLGTVNAQTFTGATLPDHGELTLVGYFSSNVAPPLGGAAETVTITFPDSTTWAASVFMTGWSWNTAQAESSSATATFKISGVPTLGP
jgi:hypothetical protein